MPPRKTRKKAAARESRGLTAPEVGSGAPSPAAAALAESIAADGGSVLGTFRDPLGGHWQILAALPIDKVEPTPFQRDLSEAHVKRLAAVMDALGRFLDPIIAVRTEEGRYLTPNGNHRLSSLKRLGGRSVVALVLPEREIAYKILALNTEKAHNLREKALEVIRMARDLAAHDGAPESQYALEFEEPAYLTLGVCYEKNGRFAGGAYHPILKRVDQFLPEALPRALAVREARAVPRHRARRGRRRRDAGPEGTRLREPLPARLRRRAHQPAALPQGRGAVVRRDPRKDDRLRAQVQAGVGQGGARRARRRVRRTKPRPDRGRKGGVP